MDTDVKQGLAALAIAVAFALVALVMGDAGGGQQVVMLVAVLAALVGLAKIAVGLLRRTEA